MNLENIGIAECCDIESVENNVIDELLNCIAAQLNNHPYLYEALGASEREEWLYGPIIRAIHCIIDHNKDFILTEAPIDYSDGIRFVDIVFSLMDSKSLFLLEVKSCGMSAKDNKFAKTNLLKRWKNMENGVVDQLALLDKASLNKGNNFNFEYLRNGTGINSVIRVPILLCSYSVTSNSPSHKFNDDDVNAFKESAAEKHQAAIDATKCKNNLFSPSKRICTTGRSSGLHQVIANGIYAGAAELRHWRWK